MRRIAPLVAVSALFVACSSSDSGSVTIVLPPGEADTFTRAPAVTTLRVDSIDSSGNATNIATATLPQTDIDLGNQDESTEAIVRVLGLDGAGVVRARGEALPIDYGALAGTSIDVFMQRTGEMSELPSPPADARHAPLLDFVGSRYVVVAGGADASLASSTELYDLVTYSAVASPPTMPIAPQSIAVNGTSILLINASGATWYDFSDGTTSTATAPSGATFADVAGGLTYYDDSGTAYVVGATRTTGAPTVAVLTVDGSSTDLAFDTLAAPRLGASAAYVVGLGLFVAGGSATADGVEVIAAGATSGTTYGYPPDPSTGAGASALTASLVLLAGGVDGSGADATMRVVDLTCKSGCAVAPWGALPEALVTAQTFAFDSDTALVVGSDASGATHAVSVSRNAATEVPLRDARSNARAVFLPTGAVGIVGGAPTMESFTP